MAVSAASHVRAQSRGQPAVVSPALENGDLEGLGKARPASMTVVTAKGAVVAELKENVTVKGEETWRLLDIPRE